MPPDSRHIDEEGVLIDNFQLVDRGRLREKELQELVTGTLPDAQFRHRTGRPESPDRGQRKGRAGTAKDG